MHLRLQIGYFWPGAQFVRFNLFFGKDQVVQIFSDILLAFVFNQNATLWCNAMHAFNTSSYISQSSNRIFTAAGLCLVGRKKIHVMNLALRCVPLRGSPWGGEDMTRGGPRAFFTARCCRGIPGHCCSSNTHETKANTEKTKIKWKWLPFSFPGYCFQVKTKLFSASDKRAT